MDAAHLFIYGRRVDGRRIAARHGRRNPASNEVGKRASRSIIRLSISALILFDPIQLDAALLGLPITANQVHTPSVDQVKE